MQSLEVVCGIFKDSYKIITSRNVNLYNITIFFILPTYFISLINKLASYQLLPQTGLNQTTTTTTTTTFNQKQQQNGVTFASYNPYSHLFSSEFAPYWILQLVFLIAALIFRLIYTSAGIYTAACIHTGQEAVMSFNKKFIAVVSKVWKRLFFTFFCTFIAFTACTAVFILILIIASATFYTMISSRAGIITISLVILFATVSYLAGFVYLVLVSSLAKVVSVLEEAGGFKAMKKSNRLLKGNWWVAVIMLFCLAIVYYVLQYALEKLVMYAWSLGMVAGAVSVAISSLLPTVFILIELVSQTVLYCVCKSYHQEKVELDQVNVSGGYAPLNTEELQQEKFSHV